jgi:hypothetical protein
METLPKWSTLFHSDGTSMEVTPLGEGGTKIAELRLGLRRWDWIRKLSLPLRSSLAMMRIFMHSRIQQ